LTELHCGIQPQRRRNASFVRDESCIREIATPATSCIAVERTVTIAEQCAAGMNCRWDESNNWTSFCGAVILLLLRPFTAGYGLLIGRELAILARLEHGSAKTHSCWAS
jgi:hypothetical protein